MTSAPDRQPLGERLRRSARQAGLANAIKVVGRRLGYDVLRRHYYSPVPDLAALPADLWTRRSELSGVRLDVGQGLEFVEAELAQFLREYSPPSRPTGSRRDFYLDNGFYGSVDAELLYAMVRYLAPRRVIELGSGWSTLVIADARARNRSETEHRVFDPYPRAAFAQTLSEIVDLRSVSLTDVPLDEFSRLQAGDVLFVDTTHTVRLGGDVNRIILDVLPQAVAPGVYVHFHDIFLPWEYPRALLELSFFWAEQYLLQAFLAFNDEFEVVVPTHALHRRFPSELAELVGGAPPATPPSSFWIRRAN